MINGETIHIRACKVVYLASLQNRLNKINERFKNQTIMRKIFITITFAVLFALLFIVSYKSYEAKIQQIKNQNKTQRIRKHEINEHLEEMVSIPKSTVDRWEATLTIMEQKLYNDMK